MDVLTAIHSRRAVRDYREESLADNVSASLIDAAIWAPSGVNLQPWSFVVVHEAATLAAFSEKAKALLLGSAADHPELASLRHLLASPTFNIFYNAPALIVICATSADEMALKDCCLAAENLMLAATAAGLGTCWIGLSEAWLNTDEGKAALGIPSGFRPVAPIVVGRPSGLPPPAPARRTADVRHVGKVVQP
jgi:nitroreductase